MVLSATGSPPAAPAPCTTSDGCVRTRNDAAGGVSRAQPHGRGHPRGTGSHDLQDRLDRSRRRVAAENDEKFSARPCTGATTESPPSSPRQICSLQSPRVVSGARRQLNG